MHARGNDIVAQAKGYIGLPWRHQGRDRKLGLDCAGVPIVVAQDLGISDFDTFRYSKRPNAKEFRRAMLEAGCRPVAKAESGDLLRMADRHWPVHVGIYERDERDREWVIHAYAPARQVVRERLTRDVWLRVREIMRLPE